MPSEHDRELGTISAQLGQILPALERIETRLREIEQWRAKLIGMALGLSLLVSLATSWVESNVSFTEAVAQQPIALVKPEEVTQ